MTSVCSTTTQCKIVRSSSRLWKNQTDLPLFGLLARTFRWVMADG